MYHVPRWRACWASECSEGANGGTTGFAPGNDKARKNAARIFILPNLGLAIRSCLRSCVRQRYPQCPTEASQEATSLLCLQHDCAANLRPERPGSSGSGSWESDSLEPEPTEPGSKAPGLGNCFRHPAADAGPGKS